MGKTADLTAVQKAIIDTLKQEGKTQKEISERIGCSQSAASRHLSGKSVGRKKCGRKRCTTRRGDRTLRKIVEKDRFQTLGDLRKQWTESGVETSRATVYRRVQEMGYRCRIPQVKPLLNQKRRQKRLTWATEKQHWTVAQWSKVLFSDESKFCMSFGNQGARVWRKTGEREMPKCLKSSVVTTRGSKGKQQGRDARKHKADAKNNQTPTKYHPKSKPTPPFAPTIALLREHSERGSRCIQSANGHK
ncbi:Transposable element Tc1 transposase [Labeo rohita]|uniref:Transposable element Tc1 transposase n=1 Tax=Labeo rohita TaxID=84645 RepID=A0ABQ8MVD4_LABRO|nr:Transposable element Tc1 transposase [Labeo rohita]